MLRILVASLCLFTIFVVCDRPSFADSILTHSTGAKGVLKCGNSPAKGAHVRLYRNHTEKRKELLATTTTDDNGSFSIEGDTVGRPQNESNIDPCLRFYHKCDVDDKKNEYRKFALRYNHTYVTLGRVPRRAFDAGILNLEIVYPKEERDKKFEAIKVDKTQ